MKNEPEERTSGDRLHVPAFLSYVCQACGQCCREYEIVLAAEEFKRLSKCDWARTFPQLAGRRLFAQSRRRGPGSPHRLSLKDDQSCVFLDADGKCLMHRHFGEKPKALACVLFPFTFAHTPVGVFVGCRFNCTAVARGLGDTLVRRRKALQRLLRRYDEAGHAARYEDVVHFDRHQSIGWLEYMHIERALVDTFLRPGLALERRIALAWRLVGLMREAKLEDLHGARFDEFVRLLAEGLSGSDPGASALPRRPRLIHRWMFNQMLFMFHHRTTASFLEMGFWQRTGTRLHNFWEGIKFLFQRGSVSLHGFSKSTTLKRVKRLPLHRLDDESSAMLARFFAGKIFGKQVFGRLYFNYDFVSGFSVLTGAYAAILWYARAAALDRGADEVAAEDVDTGIRYVDRTYGYSDAPDRAMERTRAWILSQNDGAWRMAAALGPDGDDGNGTS